MKQNKGLLLALITALISGSVVFISKLGVSVVNPYIFTGLKNILVAILVSGWILMIKDWRILKTLTKKQWALLLAVGLVGGSIPFLLYFKGLSLTLPIQAGFIHKTMFLYIAILAAIFLKEKISKGLLIGGLLLLLGNLLLLKSFAYQFGRGDLLIFSATLLWAMENIMSKHLIKSLPPRIIIWGRMFFGSILIVWFLIITGQAQLIFSLNLEQLGWTMITSVFLLGYVVSWYSALKYIKVSVAAIVLLLASPITTLLSLIFLGEFLLLSQVLGLALIALTLVLFYRFWPLFDYVKKPVVSR